MNKTPSNKFSPEVRKRTIRLVQEHRGEYPSLWAAAELIAPKMGFKQFHILRLLKSLSQNVLLDQPPANLMAACSE